MYFDIHHTHHTHHCILSFHTQMWMVLLLVGPMRSDVHGLQQRCSVRHCNNLCVFDDHDLVLTFEFSWRETLCHWFRPCICFQDDCVWYDGFNSVLYLPLPVQYVIKSKSKMTSRWNNDINFQFKFKQIQTHNLIHVLRISRPYFGLIWKGRSDVHYKTVT